MRKKMLIFSFGLILLVLCGVVKGEEGDIVIGKRITLISKVLNEDRDIWIYTPAQYERTDTSYPVIYLLDGDGHFHHATGIVQFIATRGIGPDHIVIAIPNTDRTRDLSTSRVEERPTSGGAEAFLDFFKKELFPYVESKYRTQPYRILIGHSLGGLFSVYTMLTYPDMFNAHIAISPWLVWDDGDVFKRSPDLLAKHQSLNKFLFISIGDEAQLEPTLNQFCELLEGKAPADLSWKYVKMGNENHGTLVHRTIYDGLEELYKDWRLTTKTIDEGIEAVEKHYQNLSEKFGYNIQVPEFVVNNQGYRQLGNQNYIKAIEIFQYNVKLYPNSANVYDSLGEALERNNQFDLALENYKKAVKRGKELSDPNLAVYEKNLKRMQTRVEENK